MKKIEISQKNKSLNHFKRNDVFLQLDILCKNCRRDIASLGEILQLQFCKTVSSFSHGA